MLKRPSAHSGKGSVACIQMHDDDVKVLCKFCVFLAMFLFGTMTRESERREEERRERERERGRGEERREDQRGERRNERGEGKGEKTKERR